MARLCWSDKPFTIIHGIIITLIKILPQYFQQQKNQMALPGLEIQKRIAAGKSALDALAARGSYWNFHMGSLGSLAKKALSRGSKAFNDSVKSRPRTWTNPKCQWIIDSLPEVHCPSFPAFQNLTALWFRGIWNGSPLWDSKFLPYIIGGSRRLLRQRLSTQINLKLKAFKKTFRNFYYLILVAETDIASPYKITQRRLGTQYIDGPKGH